MVTHFSACAVHRPQVLPLSLGPTIGSDALILGWLDLAREPVLSLHSSDGYRLFFHRAPRPTQGA